MLVKINTDQAWLRKPCRKVEEGDPVAEVAEKLFQVLRENENAVGISANQIGYGLRMFAMRLDPLPPIWLCIKSQYSQALLEQLPLLYQKSRRSAQALIHR